MRHLYQPSPRPRAFWWFFHRVSGSVLVIMLIVHYWVQHYDPATATMTSELLSEGELPRYGEAAQARTGLVEPTPYDLVMARLADPAYAWFWKTYNLLFLLFALHHGFYGLSNIIGDYVRHDMARLLLTVLAWCVALFLLVVGAYSVITAGWNYTPPKPG
ncbi:MAG: succinate dehydrogenase [Bacteroidetes bacterium]|nr:succinate dehydrogenase [Rhodothermia bacterium]MCS7155975.1 succinate dehydrogenase [Bacteroidota bacterium]MCX7907663.1 succinate dehydrogenase [Bacteroidota bacterium]MDW8137792.1 succinate dehydrogenase [Bacteroidota bacterium]MDW8286357.1 succinate dehydrogenase [Bacteroidota bacterium]